MKRLYLFVFFLILVGVSMNLTKPKFWDSNGKLVMVTNGKNQKITVSVIDPQIPGRTDIEIPSLVSVSVAGELGNWKLGSVWQLGVNEKLGGGLLIRTVAKNFGFPAVAWWDEATGQTNLNLGDRIRLWLFQVRLGKNSLNTIDLARTSFLRKTKLPDGEEGYRISGEVPSNVTAVFPEGAVLRLGYKAKIVNYSGSVALGESIGRVIETMGIKVASIQKEGLKDFDCAVSGTNAKVVEKLNLVFDCKDQASEPAQEGFNIVLEAGRGFVRRF